jgi:hypothetical protein
LWEDATANLRSWIISRFDAHDELLLNYPPGTPLQASICCRP